MRASCVERWKNAGVCRRRRGHLQLSSKRSQRNQRHRLREEAGDEDETNRRRKVVLVPRQRNLKPNPNLSFSQLETRTRTAWMPSRTDANCRIRADCGLRGAGEGVLKEFEAEDVSVGQRRMSRGAHACSFTFELENTEHTYLPFAVVAQIVTVCHEANGR